MSQILTAAGFGEILYYSEPPLGSGARAMIRRVFWTAIEQLERVYLHAPTGSGLLRSGHILTDNFVVCARKP